MLVSDIAKSAQTKIQSIRHFLGKHLTVLGLALGVITVLVVGGTELYLNSASFEPVTEQKEQAELAADQVDPAKYLEEAGVAEELGEEGEYSKLLSAATKYQQLDRHQEAVRVFEEALALFPEDKLNEIASYSYPSYLAVDNQRRAVEYGQIAAQDKLAEIEKEGANELKYSAVALIYEDIGQLEQAVEYYQKSLDYVEQNENVEFKDPEIEENLKAKIDSLEQEIEKE